MFEYVEKTTPETRQTIRLRRQWGILHRDDAVPDRWRTIHLTESLTLHYHPDLRVRKFPSNKSSILVLGLAVQPLGAGYHLDRIFEGQEEHRHDDLIGILETLAGTYVLVRYDDHSVVLYTDPACMMNVYYGSGRASSSPALLPNIERDDDVDRQFPFGAQNDWYPGSLCPYKGVKVLLANHALTIGTGSVARFWPNKPFRSIGEEEGIERATELLRATVTEVLRNVPTLMSLTGGRDSRVNLAAARECVDDAEFFTVRASCVDPEDWRIASRIAEVFGLRHRVILDREAPVWLGDLYDEIAGGMAIGGRRRILGACATLMSSRYVHLNGNLGYLTNCYYWPGPRPKRVSIAALGADFAHRPPVIRKALQEWLDSLPSDIDARTTFNLMYLEQRGGRLMAAGEAAASIFYESFTPCCSRQFVGVVCGMPANAQWRGDLREKFVERLWPELAELPYQSVERPWARWIPRRVKSWLRRLVIAR